MRSVTQHTFEEFEVHVFVTSRMKGIKKKESFLRVKSFIGEKRGGLRRAHAHSKVETKSNEGHLRAFAAHFWCILRCLSERTISRFFFEGFCIHQCLDLPDLCSFCSRSITIKKNIYFFFFSVYLHLNTKFSVFELDG